MTKWIEKMKSAKDLPTGHYGKKEARDFVNEEYAGARKIEFHYKKHNKRMSIEKMREMIEFICDELSVPMIRRVKVGFPKNYKGIGYAAAYCSRYEIAFSNPRCVTFVIGCHEVAHHVVNQDPSMSGREAHGEDFQIALGFCLETGLQWMTAQNQNI